MTGSGPVTTTTETNVIRNEPPGVSIDEPSPQHSNGSQSAGLSRSDDRPASLLMTVEQVAHLLFGEVGEGGSASSNCQKIRRLIPDTLPARRIGNRWYVNRATAEAWAAGGDPATVMAHPATRQCAAAYDPRRLGGKGAAPPGPRRTADPCPVERR